MKDNRFFVIVLGLYVLLLISGVPRVLASNDAVIDSFDSATPTGLVLDDNHPSDSADLSAVYQTVNITETSYITSFSIRLSKTNAPTGTGYIRIYNATGTHGTDAEPTGAALASVGLDVSLIGAEAYYNYEFSSIVTLDPGIYCLAYENPAAGITGVNYIRAYIDDDTLHDGNRGYYQNGAWVDAVGDKDILFSLYGFSNTPFTYVFSDTYYENGTLHIPPVNVTAIDGFNEEFNISGGITQYYNSTPAAFLWDIGGGITREYHSIGSENITVTIPDGTDYIYSFTVKDYTGKNPAYIESYRIINGTSTIIERMPITQPNAVRLNMVYGKAYNLKILFSDGSRYDWGYFVAAGTTTATITIRSVEFSDQIQPLYGVIMVEATRSTDGVTVTVDYNDTRENTVWANVSISIRGGAVVNTATRDNDTYTYNWAGADADLGYIVTVSGEHSDFGEWGYVKILDETEDFPDAPSLEGIFDFGLGVNLIGYALCTVTMIGFSKVKESMSVISGAVVATLLNFIGWTTYTANQIIFFWVFAIVVALALGGND